LAEVITTQGHIKIFDEKMILDLFQAKIEQYLLINTLHLLEIFFGFQKFVSNEKEKLSFTFKPKYFL